MGEEPVADLSFTIPQHPAVPAPERSAPGSQHETGM